MPRRDDLRRQDYEIDRGKTSGTPSKSGVSINGSSVLLSRVLTGIVVLALNETR